MDAFAKDLLKRALGRGRKAASAAKDSLISRVRGGEAKPERVSVRFGEVGGEVPYGASLLIAARLLRVDLDHFCGGNCSCGTCRIEVIEGAKNLSERHMNEELVLGVDGVRRGDRLACQARVQGPVAVRIPDFFLVR